MPFGLTNTPATFQHYMYTALVGLVDIVYVVYLDDILIYSHDEKDHKDYIRTVLDRLRKYNLFIKPSKCYLYIDTMEFLRFRILLGGVCMEEDRVATIRD